VGLLSNLRLIVLLGLIAHIILIHVERFAHHFRTALVALLSNLRLIVLLGLIAHIILIHVERFAHHFRTALVALLSNLRLIVLLGLIAHIILIHVERFAHHFRTALVALLSNLRLIFLLGMIATLSAFSVLHLGSRTAAGNHFGRDATANVKPILNTPRPLSWSKSHISSPPLCRLTKSALFLTRK
jgi:hypothetical protein